MTAAGAEATPVMRARRGTLAEALAGRDNALNFVRLVLASAVILSHAWPLGGYGDPPFALGGLAVEGFFAISGFLIAGSRARMAFWPYLWRRALRIFPALWACLFVIAFALAPLAAWAQGETWAATSAGQYVLRNWLLWIGQGGIDDTLRSVPALVAWNGSQWTLWYEFVAYLAAGVIVGIAVVRRRPVLLFGLLAVVLALRLAAPHLGIEAGIWVSGLRLAAFFVAGMALWSVSTRLVVHGPVAVVCALAAVASANVLSPVMHYTLMPLVLAYAVLGLGAVLPVRLGSVNDISYGVYIYAWPVQQSLAAFGLHTLGGVLGYAVLAWLVTVPLAVASWLLVEKPAMRLRTWVPARLPASSGRDQ